MGITGELVKSVFSKNRSFKTHDSNIRNNTMEKRKWKVSVKSYLCGDEFFNSVVAEEDSASIRSSESTVMQILSDELFNSVVEKEDSGSIRSSEATVMQILPEVDFVTEEIESQSIVKVEDFGQDQSSLELRSLDEDGAATVIQSAFRGFKVRYPKRKETESFHNYLERGMESPSKESMATSIEVQTGNSIGIVSIHEDDPSVSTKNQNKLKPSSFKPKEDWDDSTLDSTASKMRIQNRLEAMTRRERALAYAFSQQLRICSKKKQAKLDGSEPNMGWTWLERWMATRQIEVPPIEDCTSTQLNKNEAGTTLKMRSLSRKKFLDLSFEEKESCGSNEVPVQVNGSPNSERKDRDLTCTARNSQNRLKAPRKTSRRKTAPSYQKDHSKVGKKDATREGEKDKGQKAKHPRHGNVINVCKDDAWTPQDHSESVQNSKSDP